jgi:two-component system, OmpR family, sensor histidine kinase MprB
MSLRWKVALSLAAIAVMATIAIGTASYRTTRSRLLSEIDRSLEGVEGVLRQQFSAPGRLPERGPLSGLDARVITADGRVVESTFPVDFPVTDGDLAVSGSRRPDRIATIDTDAGTYRVRTVAFPRGAIQVGRPLDEVERVLRELRTRVLVWSLVVGAVASAVGWLIASRITASLRRLTDAAEHVESTGRLDVDVGAAGHDEVGRLTAAFDRMLAALGRSRDEQRRLVEDAGHELRTPLTSLRTNVDTLRRYPALPDADREALLADLSAETEELTELVDEIVTVASGEVSDEPFVTVDLAELVRQVSARYERRTGRSIAVAGSSTIVRVQPSSVQRAVSCLLDNARKFDPSRVPIDVEIDGTTVSVGDRGPGIADDDLGHVFERFYRADSARAQPGSGLGLSIVDAIARRHGGHAFARRRDGGGAEVGFTLSALPPPRD